MRGNTNKTPIKLNASEVKLTWWFVCEMGKTYTTKTPSSDFKVSTPKNPLLSK